MLETEVRVGRNDPCPCGSGERYKKCCGAINDEKAELVPDFSQRLQSAVQHHQAGQFAEAAAIYREILAVEPNQIDALHLLGVALTQLESYDEAIGLIKQAISLNNQVADLHYNLGQAYQGLDQLDEAAACYQQALVVQPNDPEILLNLGSVRHLQYDFNQAIAYFEQAIGLQPQFAQAYNNLSLTLHAIGETAQAIEVCTQAIQLAPDFAQGQMNLGVLYQAQGKLDQALFHLKEAVRLAPEYAKAHWHLASGLLLTGQFEQGWREYEWRRHLDTRLHGFKLDRKFPQPLWNGEPLAGKTILLHAEQGYGDTLQFVRYASLVHQLGAKVIIGCQPSLKRLLLGTTGVAEVIAYGEALLPFDYYVSLLSLPTLFKTTINTIPAQTPYITVDPQLVNQWREKLAASQAKLKIGLVWAGNSNHSDDHNRSVKLAQFAPLAELADIEFYSLQKGEAGQQAITPPPNMRMVDYTGALENYADTAALIASLDLVISVDTSVAHLAGAIGKPVWVLIPFGPDWRWLLDRDDSPWYPTMKLFRQKEPRNWQLVMSAVKEALARDCCAGSALGNILLKNGKKSSFITP